MSDDLVKRIRRVEGDALYNWLFGAMSVMNEAAARIEAQSSAIDAALTELDASLFANAEHQRAKDILRTAREATK